MTSKIMTPQEVHRERLAAFGAIFSRADSTLARRYVACSVIESALSGVPDAPAFSDGQTIYFRADKIDDLGSVQDLVRLNGLNYHELAHILYTPRAGTRLLQKVIADGYQYTFNILEDQRIETMLAGKYPSTKPYFVATFVRYCMANEEQMKTAHILAHGRRYLPREIREALSGMFEYPKMQKEAEAIIDEYRFLTPFGADEDRMFDLIKRLHILIQENVPQNEQPSQECRSDSRTKGSHEGVRVQTSASSEGKKDSERQERQDAAEKAYEDSQDGDGSGNSQGGEEEGGDEDGSGEESGDGDSSGSGKGQGAASSGEGGSGAGGPGEGRASGIVSDDQLKAILQEAMDDVLTNSEVQSDIIAKRSAIFGKPGSTESRFKYMSARTAVPDAAYQLAATKASQEFQRLAADLDPGVKTHQSAGRVNMKRVMQGGAQIDYDTAFDSWEEGQSDAAEIEVFFALDMSGSMGGMMNHASQTLWAMKRAIEGLGKGASVSAYGFESSTHLLYHATERAHGDAYKVYGAEGGTAARGMLIEARRVFLNSRKRRRLFFAITDGGWWSAGYKPGESDEKQIQQMKDSGVLTAVAYLSRNTAKMEPSQVAAFGHGADIFAQVASPFDLLPMVKTIVTNLMKG